MSPTQAPLGFLSGVGISQPLALTAEMIPRMGNNSLFTRWRPYSHFLAPAGWMNDPCGPFYDPTEDLYHFQYQWHPHHVDWGNISWGHATSLDMITWTDVDHHPDNDLQAWQASEAVSIGPTNLTSDHHTPSEYMKLSIFSGTTQPVNLSGGVDGTLMTIYTGASILPTKWDRPYLPGTESQGVALSHDHGVTWEYLDANPILGDPPGNWSVTSWRDPYFHSFNDLDAFLNQSEPHWYLVFGSGIKDVGPRMPLYSAPASDLTNWTFLGALWEPEVNSALGDPAKTGVYGRNFEMSNFFTLDGYWFTMMGIEGAEFGGEFGHTNLWNEGTVSKRENGSVLFEPIAGGFTDWGILYAITSFNDTKNNRRIQVGWANEQMGSLSMTEQGYAGANALPREVFAKYTHGVVHDPGDTEPSENYFVLNETDGSWTARTFGVRPVPEVVEGLRHGSTYSSYDGSTIGSDLLPSSFSHSLELVVPINNTTGNAGVIIGASPGREEYTTIYYNPSNTSIIVNKTYTSLIQEFPSRPYRGNFEPYQFVDGSTEPVNLHIFLDGSLLEIYVNDRFALTARMYPSRLDSKGIALYHEAGVDVSFGKVELWEGLRNAWPHRPLNSSTLLVYDTAEATGNYTWWPGT